MKIRSDFVTNSSSSSFIIARKGKLSENQKKSIVEFVENYFLGREILSPKSNEEEIKNALENDLYASDEDAHEIRKCLKKGYSIYSDSVVFDEAEYYIGNIYSKIWSIIEGNDKSNFKVINGDLNY